MASLWFAAGPDHRAGQQARQPARAGGDRREHRIPGIPA